MQISSMIIIADGILAAAGVGARTLKKHGIERKNALFLLLCVFVLKRFVIETGEGAAICTACILLAVWLFGAGFAQDCALRRMCVVLPVSMLTGMLTQSLISGPTDYSAYIIGAASIPAALILGGSAGAASAGLAPIFAAMIAYCEENALFGFGAVELSETVLASQLAGMSFCFMTEIARSAILSYARTKIIGRTYETVK